MIVKIQLQRGDLIAFIMEALCRRGLSAKPEKAVAELCQAIAPKESDICLSFEAYPCERLPKDFMVDYIDREPIIPHMHAKADAERNKTDEPQEEE